MEAPVDAISEEVVELELEAWLSVVGGVSAAEGATKEGATITGGEVATVGAVAASEGATEPDSDPEPEKPAEAPQFPTGAIGI